MSMKAAIFEEKGGELKLVNLPIPEPKAGWIRIKVHSCGVCHSDFVCKHGNLDNSFPRVPGHEVVGVIDKLGEGLSKVDYPLSRMVGVGWFGGGHCGICAECLDNQWILCKKSMVCGIHYDGGYAEYMVAPADAIAIVPKGMDPVETSPLLCAGITVFNSFRNANIKVGSLVGVQGIGGLGHLAIQFVKKLGYKVVAFSSGDQKEKLSHEFGASHYIDTSKNGWVDQAKAIGSIKCVLVTAPSASNIQLLLESLGTNGKLVILALVQEPLNASSLTLIFGNKSLNGWICGDSRHSQDTLKFAQLNNVKPIVKSFPLEEANNALNNIKDAKFRNVIKF